MRMIFLPPTLFFFDISSPLRKWKSFFLVKSFPIILIFNVSFAGYVWLNICASRAIFEMKCTVPEAFSFRFMSK